MVPDRLRLRSLDLVAAAANLTATVSHDRVDVDQARDELGRVFETFEDVRRLLDELEQLRSR